MNRSFRPGWGAAADVAFCLLVTSLLAVPAVGHLAGAIFTWDFFFHWDHFVMGPALAYGHGMPLGTEIYSQYGVGWPVVADALSGDRPLSHRSVLKLAIGYSLIVHLGLYFLLRSAAHSRALAAAGVLLALRFSLFSPLVPGLSVGTLWQWPSLTVLRAPMEVFFFAALLLHARRPERARALAMGIFAALALLLETDTGIFLCATALVYALTRALAPAFGEPGAPRPTLAIAAPGGFGIAVLAWLCVLVAGLGLASHGTLFSQPADFFVGWIGGVTNSSNRGVGAKYFTTFLQEHGAYLSASLLALGPGLLAVAFMAARLLHGRIGPTSLFAGCVGLYAVSRCALFIWRTVPVRLTLVAIPLAILVVVTLAELCRTGREEEAPDTRGWDRTLRRAVPLVSLPLAFFLVVSSPEFARYPNLWHVAKAGLPEAGAPFLAGRGDLLGVNAQHEALTRAIEALVEDVEARSASGESIAILDPVKTLVYTTTGVRPFLGNPAVFANTWFREEVHALLDLLGREGPRHVYLRKQSPVDRFQDSWKVLRRGLARHYRKVDEVEIFERWVRR